MNCRLNNLKTKNLLAEILGVDRKTLLKISKNPSSYYNVFPIYKNGKPRMVQEPKKILKVIHKKIKCILGDMDLPEYLYSGRKKRSYVDNARVHVGNSYITKMDIAKFYPSCKREFVFRFFRDKLKMPNDLAEICTNITTYNGHIPTGSPLSQILAFLIHQDVFDKVNIYARENGYNFTLYVDDLCFSTNQSGLNSKLSTYINKEIKRKGLKLKRQKIVSYGPQKDKAVTGCIITTNNQLRAPNKLKESLFHKIDPTEIHNLDKRSMEVVFGKLQAIRQIEGKNKFHSLNSKLKKQLY